MVAVRSAHLNQDEQFDLDTWIVSLKQDAKVAKRLKEVYRQLRNHCWIRVNAKAFAIVAWPRNDRNPDDSFYG